MVPMHTMRIMTAVMVFCGQCLVFDAGVLAQTDPLSEAQLAAFRPKLETLRSKVAYLSLRADCLLESEAQLCTQRKDKELALATLRKHERKLPHDIGTQHPGYRALAQSEPLSEAQLAAFRAKLENLRSKLTYLSWIADCLQHSETQLYTQRRDKEVALGTLRNSESKLAQDVRTQEAAYNDFQANLNSERDRLGKLQRDLGNLQRKRDAQEEWIRQCEAKKEWIHLWGASCRLDRDASQFLGLIKNYEGDIAAASRSEQIALNSVRSADKQLQESGRQLEEARRQSGEAAAQSARIESTIVEVSRNLATLRENLQSLQLVAIDLEVVLLAGADVDTADPRPRTARAIDALASRADEALTRSEDSVSAAGQTLGRAWPVTFNCPPLLPGLPRPGQIDSWAPQT